MSRTGEDYEGLVESLRRSGVALAAAEVHGGIYGTMCSGGEEACDRWVQECLSGGGAEQDLQDARRRLDALEAHALRALYEAHLDFAPLIPGDDAALDQRVEALALWCHGFLVGLGFGGLRLEAANELSAEVGEIIEDFSQITRAGLSSEEAADPAGAGFALAELEEYVRAGVQLVFDELQGARRADTPRPSIH